jgi:hypothetical protein
MDFALSSEQQAIRDAVLAICRRFDDAYWLKRDREGGFPHDFHARLPPRAGSAFVFPKTMAAPASALRTPRS